VFVEIKGRKEEMQVFSQLPIFSPSILSSLPASRPPSFPAALLQP
jgi:hypothetical protein